MRLLDTWAHSRHHFAEGREIKGMSTTLSVSSAAALPAAVHAPAASRRWPALDLFRFAAVILMVQGHTFNVVISDAVRAEGWYRWHNYVHGFTAPMFMFAAGLAFGITTFRRWDEHARWGRAVFKRLERYLLIVGIGYLLHLPGFSFTAFSTASESEMTDFLKVDALQLIGVTLLLAELMVVGLKRRGLYVIICGALCAAMVLLAPALWRVPVEAMMPIGLAGYINNSTGSIFPLFPWAGFIFAGIIAAHLIQSAMDRGKTAELTNRLVVFGGAFMLASLAANALRLDLFGEHNFWKTSPWFFLWRVGIVLLLLAVLSGARHFMASRPPGSPKSLIPTLGQETLVIYVAHLIVLYGSPIHRGMLRAWGRELELVPSILVVGAMFAAMTLLAWTWHHLKETRPSQFQVGRLALLGGVLLYTFY